MQRNYHKWHSPNLGRDMELLEFGQAGFPLLIFPTSMGRFYQYEDNGMIAARAAKYDSGQLHAFCVDSIDNESWYNRGVPPADRARRHNAYERYIVEEVLPFIRSRNADSRLAVTGCSFGGFHSVNIALKRPDKFTHCLSMSGAYDLQSFLGGFGGDEFYFNQPLSFLPNLTDAWYLDRIRAMNIILAVGENDICRSDNERLSRVLAAKSIPHYLDIWGNGAAHDWPIWRRMAEKFF